MSNVDQKACKIQSIIIKYVCFVAVVSDKEPFEFITFCFAWLSCPHDHQACAQKWRKPQASCDFQCGI